MGYGDSAIRHTAWAGPETDTMLSRVVRKAGLRTAEAMLPPEGLATSAALLAAFAACLGGPLRIILEVATTGLATFPASLGGPFAVFCKVAFAAPMLCHDIVLSEWFSMASLACLLIVKAQMARGSHFLRASKNKNPVIDYPGKTWDRSA